MSSVFEIGPVVLKKKIRMLKDNDNDNNDDNEDGRQRTNFVHKSSLKPLAQMR